MENFIINKIDILRLSKKGQIPKNKYLIPEHNISKRLIGNYLVEFANQQFLSQKNIEKLVNSRKHEIVKGLIERLKPTQATEEIIKRYLIFKNYNS